MTQSIPAAVRRLGRAVQVAALAALLWWALADNTGWRFGAVAIAAAVAAAMAFAPAPQRWSPLGLVRFIGYFCKESMRAGLQVAWLACRPRPALRPLLRDYPLRLPVGPARNLFVLTSNLLPGSLSADLEGDVVRVHVLSAELESDLKRLEELIAGLFAIPTAELD